MNDAIRRALIIAAADLWSGTPVSEIKGTEYLKGQVDLIANSTGAFAETDEPHADIEARILALVSE